MNRLVAFGVSGWLAFAALGACQGPDSFDRPHEGGVGGAGGKIAGVGGHGVGGNGVAGSGAGGVGMGGRGMGGMTATGGRGVGGAGIGGARATGGTTGAGGTGTGGRGTGGRTGDAGGTNCITAIQGAGYAFSPAAPCSACMENGNSLTVKCMQMIDCLGAGWPCTGNCKTTCLNSVGGSGPLSGCVDALLTAAGCGP